MPRPEEKARRRRSSSADGGSGALRGYDGDVEDEGRNEVPGDPTQVPGERRPERQLERPPSDRYVEVEPVATEPAGRSRPWGIAGAIAAAVVGAGTIAVAGGKLTVTAGLLVIAAALGWVVAALIPVGADPSVGRTGRRAAATLIAIGGVLLGQVGLWVIARQEGGTLDPIEYLAEVFGFLVPLELALAGAVAWWRTA